MNEWHHGPPPCIGWWPTESDWFRWWDGECWSYGCKFNTTREDVENSSAKKIDEWANDDTKWTHWRDCYRFLHFADKSKLPEPA